MKNNQVYLSFDMNGNFLSYNEKSDKVYAGSVASVEYYVEFTENLSSNDLVYISFIKPDNQTTIPYICERLFDNKFKFLSTGEELNVEIASVENLTILVMVKYRNPITSISQIKTHARIEVSIFPGGSYKPGLIENSLIVNFEEHLNNVERQTIKSYNVNEIEDNDFIYDRDGFKLAPAIYRQFNHKLNKYSYDTGEIKEENATGNLLVTQKIYYVTTGIIEGNETRHEMLEQCECFIVPCQNEKYIWECKIYSRILYFSRVVGEANFKKNRETEFIDISYNESLKRKLASVDNKMLNIQHNFQNFYTKNDTYNKEEIDNQVDRKISDAISTITDNAPEAFDTLKEVADWIANDETGTAKMLERIDDIENEITELNIKNANQDTMIESAVKIMPQTLTEKQKLQARQNIGAGTFTLQGNYEEVKNQIINELAISNPNILMNGDFKVNQRGFTSTNKLIYTVDRWRYYVDNDTGDTLLALNTNGSMTINNANALKRTIFSQYLEENDYKKLYDKMVTLSAKVNGEVVSCTGVVTEEASGKYKVFTQKIIGRNSIIRFIHNSNNLYQIDFWVEVGDVITIEWVKLEVGSVPTPFVPKKYVEELLACQRFYYKWGAKITYNIFTTLFSNWTANSFTTNFSLPVVMRLAPTIKMNGNFRLNFNGETTTEDVISITNASYNAKEIALNCKVETGKTWTTATLQSNNDINASIEFDAEIY